MDEQAFTPPPLDSYQGPAAGETSFTPPPLSSYQGPSSSPGRGGSSAGASDVKAAREERLRQQQPEGLQGHELGVWRNQRAVDLMDHAKEEVHPDDKGVLRMLWDKVNPFAIAEAPPLPGATAVEGGHGPVSKAIGAVVGAGINQGKDAVDSFRKGDYGQAAGHAAAAALPIAGPMAVHFGDAAGEAIGSALGGNPNPTAAKEAVTDALAAVIPWKLGKLIPKDVPVVPALKNPNPAIAEAVRWGLDHDIPVDAATATGNASVKAAKHLADRSFGGSLVAGKERQAAADALAQTGRKLAEDIHPNPVVPEQAGQAVQDALQGRSDASAAKARAAYDALDRITSDPQHLKEVQVGTKVHELTGANGQPMVDAQGNPISVELPVMKQIQLPVDMRPVKQALQSVYDQLSERMPPAQREADPSLNAIRNILQRPDHIPAAIADKDLSYLKGIKRSDAASDQVKHFAGKAIDGLDQAVQAAVTDAGPEALKRLSEGRAATIDKYAARDVLDNLRDEPVQTFNQAVYRNDAGIEQLRAVKKFAPAEMPKLGRAYLDNLLDKATAEGAFNKEQGLFSQWQNLGPETKKILFDDPAKIKALDNFFLLAKKMGENPNPSGTAHVASIGAQGAYTLIHPVTGIPIQVGGAILSKLLSSPKATRVLTEGLRIPISDKVKSLATANEVLSVLSAANRKTQEDVSKSR